MRARRERGEFEGGGGGGVVTREQVESFRKGEKYCEGPYRQWVGHRIYERRWKEMRV